MNFGQGNIGLNSNAPAGAPFPVGSADNGLSVDSITGRIVLGNDLGGGDAQLLSNREIPLSGNTILFSSVVTGQNTQFNILPGRLFTAYGNVNNAQLGSFDTGAEILLNSNSLFVPLAKSRIRLQNTDFPPNTAMMIRNGEEGVALTGILQLTSGAEIRGLGLYGTTGNVLIGLLSNADPGIKLKVEGDIMTDQGALPNPPQPWRFGDRVAGAAVVDATQYLEVEVGGNPFKIALIV